MEKSKEIKRLSFEEALEKLKHFCAYQERCRRKVIQKMLTLKVEEGYFDRIIHFLEEDNYLNDLRFQSAYVRGKSKLKGWGPEKIRIKLRAELGYDPDPEIFNDSDFEMEVALNKLDKELEKKWNVLKQKGNPQAKAKLLRFCISRGFDLETAYRKVEKLR